jgi:hypothetical protein
MYVSTILTQIKTAPNDTLLLLELEVSEWGSRVGSGRLIRSQIELNRFNWSRLHEYWIEVNNCHNYYYFKEPLLSLSLSLSPSLLMRLLFWLTIILDVCCFFDAMLLTTRLINRIEIEIEIKNRLISGTWTVCVHTLNPPKCNIHQ